MQKTIFFNQLTSLYIHPVCELLHNAWLFVLYNQLFLCISVCDFSGASNAESG